MVMEYIAALATPRGRISRAAFVGLYLPVMFALVWLHTNLCALEGEEVYGLWLAIYMVLMWSQYCLLSRRFQDADFSGLIVLPFYLAGAYAFLIEIDPSLVGEGVEDAEAWLGYAESLRSFASAFLGMIWIYLIVAEGTTGPNSYGPEFGTGGAGVSTAKRDRIRERVREEHGLANLPRGPQSSAAGSSAIPGRMPRSGRSAGGFGRR